MSYKNGPQIVTNGLVMYFDAGNHKSYSGAGTSWFDLSVNSFQAELINTPIYTINGNNSFFAFVSNKYARIQNSTLLDTQTPTVEVWIKTNNTFQNGFWFEKGIVNQQYSLFQEGANIQWRHYISGVGITNLTTNSINAGLNTTDWFQVTGTYSSGQRKLYINGVLKNSDSRTGTISTNTGGMSIGVFGGYSGSRGYYYNGNLAICKVYNRELNNDEILQNYNALKRRFGLS
jgi:hypothetical protein